MTKSWSEAKKAHRNTRLSVTVTLRGDLVDEVDRLEAEMAEAAKVDATENRDPVALRIAERIQDLEREAAESEVTFTFEGLGRGQMAKLTAAHPPRTDDEGDVFGAEKLPWNPETFPPALLAASCVEPAELAGNVEEWTEIHTEWNTGQVANLWGCCLQANNGVGITPKSRAAYDVLARRSSGNNSDTASR